MVAGWKCGRSHVAGLTVGGTRRPCCTLGHKTSPPACWKFLACLWSLMHGSKVICYWDWVKCRRTRRLWEADEESVVESELGWDSRVAAGCTPPACLHAAAAVEEAGRTSCPAPRHTPPPPPADREAEERWRQSKGSRKQKSELPPRSDEAAHHHQLLPQRLY